MNAHLSDNQLFDSNPKLLPFIRNDKGLILVSEGGGFDKAAAMQAIIQAHKTHFEKNLVYAVTEQDLMPVSTSSRIRRIDEVTRAEPTLFVFYDVRGGEMWHLVAELVSYGGMVLAGFQNPANVSALDQIRFLMDLSPGSQSECARADTLELFEYIFKKSPFLHIHLTQVFH
jgi:hypothetical protein